MNHVENNTHTMYTTKECFSPMWQETFKATALLANATIEFTNFNKYGTPMTAIVNGKKFKCVLKTQEHLERLIDPTRRTLDEKSEEAKTALKHYLLAKGWAKYDSKKMKDMGWDTDSGYVAINDLIRLIDEKIERRDDREFSPRIGNYDTAEGYRHARHEAMMENC